MMVDAAEDLVFEPGVTGSRYHTLFLVGLDAGGVAKSCHWKELTIDMVT